MSRVVLTGIGMVGPTGVGSEPFWQTLCRGQSAIKELTRFDTASFPARIGGEVPGREYEELVDPKRLRRMPLVSRLGVAAARLALKDAGYSRRWESPERVGVVLGTSLGGYKEGAEQVLVLHERGMSRVNPFLALSSFNHATAGEVAIEAGAQGINLTQSVGCPSALCAVGVATDLIRRGALDVCITGGAEAPLFPIVYAAMCQAHELSISNERPHEASRPFDKDHNGIVLSEGSCILILEAEAVARARGVSAYLEVAGYAIGSEAFEMYGIEPTGQNAATTLQRAILSADATPADIQYISAHGNSCPRWDIKETSIIKKAFGEYAACIPVSSIKGAIGHNFGAAGAFQIASVALAMKTGTVPATANLNSPDPECDLRLVRGSPLAVDLSTALVSNFGYGGVNAFMVLRKPH